MPAAGDCELIRDAFLGQPVNALSSLAYVVVAFMLMASRRVLAASAAGVVGIGSFLFHGPMPGVAKLVHDASLVALLVVLVVEYLLWRPQLGAVLKPMALMAVAVTVFAVSRTGGPLCHPESLLQGHAFWHGLSAAALWVWERALR